MLEARMILLTAVLPALILIYYIYRKDKYQREPTGQLLKAFGYGVLSVVIVLTVFAPVIRALSIPEPQTVGQAVWNAFFTAGIPEETAKLFCLWLFLRRNPWFDEYIDGIVYAVCVGMGFAAVENIGYLFSNAEAWLQLGILRALMPVPGHFFFAVAMGYFYSKASFGRPAQRSVNFALALLVPILLHGTFDALLMASDAVGGATVFVALFVGLWWYMYATSRKRIREHLQK